MLFSLVVDFLLFQIVFVHCHKKSFRLWSVGLGCFTSFSWILRSLRCGSRSSFDFDCFMFYRLFILFHCVSGVVNCSMLFQVVEIVLNVVQTVLIRPMLFWIVLVSIQTLSICMF